MEKAQKELDAKIEFLRRVGGQENAIKNVQHGEISLKIGLLKSVLEPGVNLEAGPGLKIIYTKDTPEKVRGKGESGGEVTREEGDEITGKFGARPVPQYLRSQAAAERSQTGPSRPGDSEFDDVEKARQKDQEIWQKEAKEYGQKAAKVVSEEYIGAPLSAVAAAAGGWIVKRAVGDLFFPKDFVSKRTVNRSSSFKSEGEARTFAKQKLGKDPVSLTDNKVRSQDGKWQYRAKPIDTGDNHVHLERLDPVTGEVLENWHLEYPSGSGR